MTISEKHNDAGSASARRSRKLARALACPPGLEDRGRRARDVIIGVILSRLPNASPGSLRIFVSPAEYARIEPSVGPGYVLALIYQDSDVRMFFDADTHYFQEALEEEMAAALKAAGFWPERVRSNVDSVIWPASREDG